VDIEARTDATHREILGMLPPDLMDFTDFDTAVANLMALLAAAPVELPESVVLEDHHVTTADGHDLLIRLYRPGQANTSRAALYWIHGGGMVLGDVSMDDAHCADIAAELNIVVASVDYRLAADWPYPTPLDDCTRGFDWLVEHAESLGVDVARIAVGGASAGGGLAAGMALKARDRGTSQPCFQLLRYPMLDDRNDTTSSHAITDFRVWNREANLLGWGAYLAGNDARADVEPYAAPARATDLKDLPPAIVTVGDLDLFLDEDIAYAQALLAAGVPTELHVYPGAFHGSNSMVPHADASQRWKRDEMAALRRSLDC
jgi:acetyl esterase/lipase